MNVGLETLTELVSMIWNADVNNGAGIVLCDSSKLNKNSKICHVYGIGDVCQVPWSEEERINFINTVTPIMPVDKYLELKRKEGNPIKPYSYFLDRNCRFEFDSEKIKIYEELNNRTAGNNRYYLINNEIVQIKIAGAEAYIQNVDSRVEEYTVINIDKMVEDTQVVANQEFIGCILKESLNLKSTHMQYVIPVVTGSDAPSLDVEETVGLLKCRDLNIRTSSIDGIIELNGCSKLNILADNSRKSQSYLGKTLYIRYSNSIKADIDFENSCDKSRIYLKYSSGIKLRVKNTTLLDIDTSRKSTGAYADIHVDNVGRVIVDNDSNCEITIITKKVKASMPDKFIYKLIIDSEGNITWKNEDEAAGNARINFSSLLSTEASTPEVNNKTVVYAGVAIMNGNKEPDPNEEKEVHAAIKIGGKKDRDKRHVSMAQRFKEKFKL